MSPSSAGVLLREWRELRRFSQLELSARAEVSTKHLSYLETGRSRPSSEMVMHLCEHLDVPLRARNELLVAAGHAPRYPERAYDSSDGSEVRAMIDLVLEAHHYPATVVDRRFDVVAANRACSVFLTDVADHLMTTPMNLVRLSLHPDGLANRIVNFDEYAQHMIGRLRRLVARDPDPVLVSLVDEFGHLATMPTAPTSGIVLPLVLELNGHHVQLFSTVTTFGTPHEVTLSELAIETFYPADADSRRILDEELLYAGRPSNHDGPSNHEATANAT